ncbi:MAG: transcriptional regulator [Acidimicrobiales bacterium]
MPQPVVCSTSLPGRHAAFHLDKAVAVGLLQVDRRRPAGRTGRGAGRPAKWYSRVSGEVAVSVPERHYELAAQLLAEAAERTTFASRMVDALRGAAHRRGWELGADLRGRADDRTPTVDDVVSLLDTIDYERGRAERRVTMANCPFHALAVEHPELICGVNLPLLQVLVEAAGLRVETARLDPAPRRCCVTMVA